MKEDVLAFIKHFQNEGTIKTFTNGCCYWFADILAHRFWESGAEIYYNPVENHFACCIEGFFFDITGEIPCTHLVDWKHYQSTETSEARRIYLNCILKVDL